MKAIGAITILGKRYELRAGGTWHGPSADYTEMLNVTYSPDRFGASTAVLPFGFQAVQAAAKKFGDENPELPAFQPDDEAGRIH